MFDVFDNDCIAALLPCVSHKAGSVLHPFVVTRSPTCDQVSACLLSLSSLIALRTQPSRVTLVPGGSRE